MDRPWFIAAPTRSPQPSGPAEWGTPMPLMHPSVADVPEKKAVAQVFDDPCHREMLLNIKGIDSAGAQILREVELRTYRRRLQGDLDVLVVPPGAPAQATAIQVKRFSLKLDAEGLAHDRANHLEALFEKGVDQANRTARLGFSQVYLWIFVLIDARAQNGGRFTYDGANSTVRSRIESAISPRNLSPTVGLMDFKWVQPIDRAPFTFGSSGSHLRHLAQKTATQPDDLTAWVRQLTG